ncbi:FAD-dependent oxidoreductase [Aestuariibius sp. HNIBRBA575]|uniref:FAD-dependent oxidoreductase n=1 Tax=Aestuariibius sp. HNIBRBA575 TaxID=3233343 RepID=UPI0034A15745
MCSSTHSSTIVVGAGIIGASLAYELQKRGQRVVLVDRDEPGRGASFGPLASIAITEFLPVARMSIWKQVPGWMLDPEGPVRISPRYFPKLIPWFLRFLKASRPSTVRHVEQAGATLSKRALSDTQTLLQELGLSAQISQHGSLTLYANETEFMADRERIDMLERFGFDYEVLDGRALHRLEPEITNEITKAVLLPDNKTVADPFAIVQRLIERFKALGGEVCRAEVMGFNRGDRITGLNLTTGEYLKADQVILCAGAFTGRLARMLDEPIPLETERGYHTQLKSPGLELKHSIIWPAKAFMVSPTAGGIRVGGTVEMAGLDAPPNYDRAKVTVRGAQHALPNLQVNDHSEWMGHRPAFPDTIPLMSPSAKTPGLFYATGHGHLGLTYAATTARLMGDLVTGQTPEIDMTPYHINRF